MYFEKKSDILKIAKRTGCAIFVLPDDEDVVFKKALILSPEEKSVITIEQVRDVLARLNMRQVEDQFVIIRPADALGDEAANAMLKNLEEPGEKVHFVLITGAPSALLPTILSRAEIYFLKTTPNIDHGLSPACGGELRPGGQGRGKPSGWEMARANSAASEGPGWAAPLPMIDF